MLGDTHAHNNNSILDMEGGAGLSLTVSIAKLQRVHNKGERTRDRRELVSEFGAL